MKTTPIILIFSKSMRRFFLAALISVLSLGANAQVKHCVYFDGYWSDWTMDYLSGWQIRGSYSGFMIYLKDEGPWNPLFKFSIDNFYMPDTKTRKYYYSSGQWYEFSGTVEYYISDDYLSAYQAFKSARGVKFVNPKNSDGRPTKKQTSRATIKIAPYKDHPKCYNIWYDNVGFGIDLNNLSF